jgi:tetratricopeptide (TPR) repeat protein
LFFVPALVLSLDLLYIFIVTNQAQRYVQPFNYWKEVMMATLKHLRRAVILLTLLVGINFTIISCTPGKCIPPNCPATPQNATPESWQPLLEEGNYEQVIKETDAVIGGGESAPYYAEAQLYRGFSTVKINGNLDEAKSDLEIAESRLEELSTVDATKEQVLLFRGLMIINVKFGNFEIADSYFNKAIELMPDQKDMIIKEYEEANQQ